VRKGTSKEKTRGIESALTKEKLKNTFLTNLTSMKGMRMVSILFMIAVSAVLVSGFTNIATAQTNKTTSDSKNYKDFQKCLSSAEAAKGYATKQEIKGCYTPIYNPTANSSTTTTPTNVSPSTSHLPPLSPTP
jgi:predicted negative regulator of RcsB-dependent stress response